MSSPETLHSTVLKSRATPYQFNNNAIWAHRRLFIVQYSTPIQLLPIEHHIYMSSPETHRSTILNSPDTIQSAILIIEGLTGLCLQSITHIPYNMLYTRQVNCWAVRRQLGSSIYHTSSWLESLGNLNIQLNISSPDTFRSLLQSAGHQLTQQHWVFVNLTITDSLGYTWLQGVKVLWMLSPTNKQ
jgi:hypothetical protein